MNRWINPFLKSYTISDTFGTRISPITGKLEFHNGVDVATPMREKIQMMFDGYLDIYIDGVGTKYLVMIEKSTNHRVDLLHIDEVINPRRDVKQGEIVGFTGNSGKYTTGPHTHISLRKDWENNRNNYSDPLFITVLPYFLELQPMPLNKYEFFVDGKIIAHNKDFHPMVEEIGKNLGKDFKIVRDGKFEITEEAKHAYHLLVELRKAQSSNTVDPVLQEKANKYDNIKKTLKDLLS